VDEIHTLVGREAGRAPGAQPRTARTPGGRRIQRIGLSATVRPLEEAARFLGGQTFDAFLNQKLTLDQAYD
jgi:ATP-dependent helicase Lhr and Lhr-like helicase